MIASFVDYLIRQGVRQRMFRLYGGKNISGFVLAVRIPDSEGWMRRSTFCLAPAGFGWCVCSRLSSVTL